MGLVGVGVVVEVIGIGGNGWSWLVELRWCHACCPVISTSESPISSPFLP